MLQTSLHAPEEGGGAEEEVPAEAGTKAVPEEAVKPVKAEDLATPMGPPMGRAACTGSLERLPGCVQTSTTAPGGTMRTPAPATTGTSWAAQKLQILKIEVPTNLTTSTIAIQC